MWLFREKEKPSLKGLGEFWSSAFPTAAPFLLPQASKASIRMCRAAHYNQAGNLSCPQQRLPKCFEVRDCCLSVLIWSFSGRRLLPLLQNGLLGTSCNPIRVCKHRGMRASMGTSSPPNKLCPAHPGSLQHPHVALAFSTREAGINTAHPGKWKSSLSCAAGLE